MDAVKRHRCRYVAIPIDCTPKRRRIERRDPTPRWGCYGAADPGGKSIPVALPICDEGGTSLELSWCESDITRPCPREAGMCKHFLM
ncbi:unnamed protein product [Parnassius mnemosyne]|uniref:Uncharacterized protein n=1 Tax=Parnassius mnemosyne TaxID=213953 RepID=A0AAV1LTY5_9NEOP